MKVIKTRHALRSVRAWFKSRKKWSGIARLKCFFISSYVRIRLSVYWGEPERAPHRSVVDADGTSIACPTIYATYTVADWWYERHMPDNLRNIHGGWLVVRPSHA